MPSVFAGASSGSGADRRRRVEHRQLDPAVAVRGPQHRDVLPDVVDPDDTLHPPPLDRSLALQLHAELDEERDDGVEVLDDDEDVVHPLDRHAGLLASRAATVAASSPGRSRQAVLDTSSHGVLRRPPAWPPSLTVAWSTEPRRGWREPGAGARSSDGWSRSRWLVAVGALAAVTSCAGGDADDGARAPDSSSSTTVPRSMGEADGTSGAGGPGAGARGPGAGAGVGRRTVAVVGIVREEQVDSRCASSATSAPASSSAGSSSATCPAVRTGFRPRPTVGRFDGETSPSPTARRGRAAADRTPSVPRALPGAPRWLAAAFPSDPGALDAYIAAHRTSSPDAGTLPVSRSSCSPAMSRPPGGDRRRLGRGGVRHGASRYTEDHILAVYRELSSTPRGRPGPFEVPPSTPSTTCSGSTSGAPTRPRSTRSSVRGATRSTYALPRGPRPAVTDLPPARAARPRRDPASSPSPSHRPRAWRHSARSRCSTTRRRLPVLRHLRFPEARVQPIWPYGSRALRDPVRIVDAAGAVVLHEGDRFSIGGGEVGPPGQEPTCGATTTWVPGGNQPVIDG